MFNAMSKMKRCSNFFDTDKLYPRSSPPLRCGACKKELVITRIPLNEIGGQSIETGTLFKVGIYGEITTPNKYIELIYELLNASEEDKFEITIRSPGGSVASGFVIINAMEACKAHITTIATGIAASSAAFIWSFGHTLVVNDWALIMYHMSSHTDIGKSAQIAERAVDVVEFIKYFTGKVLAKGLITPEELSRAVDEKSDVTIFAEDMRNRIASGAKQQKPAAVDTLETTEGGDK
jgi:ATP-dependent Clp protease protease subunit